MIALAIALWVFAAFQLNVVCRRLAEIATSGKKMPGYVLVIGVPLNFAHIAVLVLAALALARC